MSYALLGEIVFDVLNAPTALDDRQKAVYATHEVLSGKPVLQAMGLDLTELSLDVYLHHVIADVESRYQSIINAKDKLEPLALVMGNQYKGHYVITDVDSGMKFTDHDGVALARQLSIKLTEFVGDVTPPVLGEAVQMGNTAPLATVMNDNPVASSLLAGDMPELPQTRISKALGTFHKARQLIGRAKDIIVMARLDPAGSLLAIGNLGVDIGSWLGDMGVDVEALQGLGNTNWSMIGERMQTVGQFLTGLTGVGEALQNIYLASQNLQIAAMGSWIAVADEMSDKASTIANDVMTPAAQMTSWIAIRQDVQV